MPIMPNKRGLPPLNEDTAIETETFDPQDCLILVVDDAPLNLRVLRGLLADSYRLTLASKGEQVLKRVKMSQPDLILLDLMMPGMDGLAVCRQLKQHAFTAEIPVIFLTASHEMEHLTEAFEQGAVDYITKPFRAPELLARIRTHLELSHLRRRLLHTVQELKQTNDVLHQMVHIDSLTKIPNRRLFDEYLAQEWQRLRRDRQPLSLILMDIDHFKNYNDAYGHVQGDACLHAVAQALSEVIKRPADIVARYGGEEFAAVLPHTKRGGAVGVGKRP